MQMAMIYARRGVQIIVYPGAPCSCALLGNRPLAHAGKDCRCIQHHHGPRTLGATATGAGCEQPAVCGHLLSCARPRLQLPGKPSRRLSVAHPGLVSCPAELSLRFVRTTAYEAGGSSTAHKLLASSASSHLQQLCMCTSQVTLLWLQAWGHSSVFSPWGECLGTTGHEPATVYADLDLAEMKTRRQNMPLAQQKRPDLYELVDKA